MNILLVQPAQRPEAPYPLGLALVASAIRPDGHELSAVDSRQESIAAIGQRARSVDLVLVAVPRGAEAEAARIVGAVSGPPVVVAGPDPARRPGHWVESIGARWVIIGDGVEHSWGGLPIWSEAAARDLVRAVDAGTPPDRFPGVVGAGGTTGVVRPRDTDFWPTLEADRTLFPVADYCDGMLSRARPYAPILTSRGCDSDCAYCPIPGTSGVGFASRPVEAIVDEMLALHRDHGVRSIHIEDDRFARDRERVMEICHLLRQKRPEGLTWELPNGIRVADVADADLLEAMASAGCRSMTLAVERIRPPGSTDMSSSEDLDHVAWVARRAERAGIAVDAYLMIGFPGETEEQIRYTLARARDLMLLGVQISVLEPLAGSALAAGWQAQSRDRLTADRLGRLRRWGMLRHHGHWSRLIPLLAMMLRRPRNIVPLVRKAFAALTS